MEEKYKHGLLWQDYQHNQLLDCIGSLNKSRNTEQELIEFKVALQFLEFYVKAHFDLEEYYMHLMNYPEALSHKKGRLPKVSAISSTHQSIMGSRDLPSDGSFLPHHSAWE